jgi:hypothetical protein
MAQLYPRALGSLYVVSYDSQGYGGGILTLPVYISGEGKRRPLEAWKPLPSNGSEHLTVDTTVCV